MTKSKTFRTRFQALSLLVKLKREWDEALAKRGDIGFGRKEDPVPVVCLNCKWIGKGLEMEHTYGPGNEPDDVETVDLCPECHDDNFIMPTDPNFYGKVFKAFRIGTKADSDKVMWAVYGYMICMKHLHEFDPDLSDMVKDDLFEGGSVENIYELMTNYMLKEKMIKDE